MTDIPVTYVPARNTISLALAWAETLGAEDLFIGVNALDYSGYPDCRPEYIRAFVKLANLATKAGVEGKSQFRVHMLLVTLSRAAIVQRARCIRRRLRPYVELLRPEAGRPPVRPLRRVHPPAEGVRGRRDSRPAH